MDHSSEKTQDLINTIFMFQRIQCLTLPEIIILGFLLHSECPISFPLTFSKCPGVKIQRTLLLLPAPLPPACVE